MPDFKKMYYTLAKAQSKAMTLLEDAVRKTEEMYLDDKDPISIANTTEDTSPTRNE